MRVELVEVRRGCPSTSAVLSLSKGAVLSLSKGAGRMSAAAARRTEDAPNDLRSRSSRELFERTRARNLLHN
jgi:hypothetical protein